MWQDACAARLLVRDHSPGDGVVLLKEGSWIWLSLSGTGLFIMLLGMQRLREQAAGIPAAAPGICQTEERDAHVPLRASLTGFPLFMSKEAISKDQGPCHHSHNDTHESLDNKHVFPLL